MWLDDIPAPCTPVHGYGRRREKSHARPNPRSANGHRRRQLRKWLASLGRPCGICGRPIDYSLPPGHPMSFEVDEIVPVSLGGDPLDRGNVQAAHRICNQRKGNRLEGSHGGKRGGRGLPMSRDW